MVVITVAFILIVASFIYIKRPWGSSLIGPIDEVPDDSDDNEERCFGCAGKDDDNDGLPNWFEDDDGDGILNLNEDDDGDGMMNRREDDDGDGIPNGDEDDDNDGISNENDHEARPEIDGYYKIRTTMEYMDGTDRVVDEKVFDLAIKESEAGKEVYQLVFEMFVRVNVQLTMLRSESMVSAFVACEGTVRDPYSQDYQCVTLTRMPVNSYRNFEMTIQPNVETQVLRLATNVQDIQYVWDTIGTSRVNFLKVSWASVLAFKETAAANITGYYATDFPLVKLYVSGTGPGSVMNLLSIAGAQEMQVKTGLYYTFPDPEQLLQRLFS